MKRILISLSLIILLPVMVTAYEHNPGWGIGGHLFGAGLRRYNSDSGFWELRVSYNSGVVLTGLRRFWLTREMGNLNLYMGVEGDSSILPLNEYGFFGAGLVCAGYISAEYCLGRFSLGADIGPAVSYEGDHGQQADDGTSPGRPVADAHIQAGSRVSLGLGQHDAGGSRFDLLDNLAMAVDPNGGAVVGR